MQWGKNIPAQSTYDKPIISLDIFSTVLANINGARKLKNPLDGVDLLPYLTHKNKKAPHDVLFWRSIGSKSYAVIDKNEKKLLILKDSTFLYDLKNEIKETTNIINKEKELANDLNSARTKWEKGMIAPVFLGLTQREEYNKLKGKTLKN